MALEFRLLGPLEVFGGGHCHQLYGTKQRALLATLLVVGNQAVSVDRLIANLWPRSRPRDAVNALQAHVGRLRRQLATWEPDATQPRLATLNSGYRLRSGPDELDSSVFRQLSTEGRRIVQNDPELAVQTLMRALALWRGEALQDVAGGSLTRAAADRLEETRVMTREMLATAQLACDRCDDAVETLEDLVADSPLKEGLYSQLMLALYRSGRYSEALETYHTARHRLAYDLGIEPSPMLGERMRAILTHDESLLRLSK
jgi:SARP family transcriptional regulator, regulator of embCAB operon